MVQKLKKRMWLRSKWFSYHSKDEDGTCNKTELFGVLFDNVSTKSNVGDNRGVVHEVLYVSFFYYE